MSGPENNVPRDDLREQAIARARKMLDNDASDPEIVAATGITRAELDGAAPKPYIDPVTIHRTRYEHPRLHNNKKF